MEVQCSQPTGRRLTEEQEHTKTELFESVIAKYFEIIKTILPRISTLYLENQEFQRGLYDLQSKMAKIEKDHENLHYQMRTNHLFTDNKLNHILSEYSNISSDYSRIKQQNEDLYKEIKEIRYIQTAQKQVHEFNQREPNSDLQLRKEKSKKITFLQICSDKEQSSNTFKSRKSIKFSRNNSINLDIEESLPEPQQQQFNPCPKQPISRVNIDSDSVQSLNNSKLQSKKSIDLTQRNNVRVAMKSEKVMRKTNLKSTAKVGTQTPRRKQTSISKSQRVFPSHEEQLCSADKYKQILKEIEAFYKKNQNMKQNYEYLMAQYCKTNEKQYSKLDDNIHELRLKIAEIDNLHMQFERTKVQLDNKVTAYHKDIDAKLNSKMEIKHFQDFADQTNTRITGLHEERKKLANKQETKRAIEFLQTKINYVINEMLAAHEKQYPKLHLIELQISHLTSRVQALPINKQKSSFYSTLGDRKQRNIDSTTRNGTATNATAEGFSSTKRQVQSLHYKILSDKMGTEEKTESCSLHKQRATESNSTLRVRRPKEKDNLIYLKERSRQLLSRGEKPKQRAKLRKERILFSYDP